jgi:predicted Zn-dependent protease
MIEHAVPFGPRSEVPMSSDFVNTRRPLRGTLRSRLACAVLAAGLLAPAAPLPAQDVDPGFNLFSVEQDVEIGRQSAAEAEKQLPMLGDRSVDRYVGDVLERLAAEAPGARYPYQVKVVNATDVNAFTLPGGFMYVNRGLLEAARNESELAAVLAHETAHVALRHGTHQASKALVARAGIGILGALLDGDRGKSGRILDTIGGVGLNAVFLKFSRDAEHEADLVGARMMRDAGYDPAAMAGFFELLQREQRRNPSRVEQFFSSHPSPADRAGRIRAEARRLGRVERAREVGGFDSMQAELRDLPEPRSPRAGLRSNQR